jgi:uncharacterized membrane protein YccC
VSFGGFAQAQLAPNRGRIRAFLRVQAALLIASAIAITFKPINAYWIVVYILLVTSPTVGNSVRTAIARFRASLIGCGVAVLLVIASYDAPWFYLPGQAIVLAIVLFIGLTLPVGPAIATGGATFAIIVGSDAGNTPELLITLAFYRVWESVIGGAIGAFAQLLLWPDDPVDMLRRSLAAQLEAIESALSDGKTRLDAARVARHIELLNNAEMRHPALARRRCEIAALVLDVAGLVDQAQHRRDAAPDPALPGAISHARQAVYGTELFAPPPAPPEPMRPTSRIAWRELRQERVHFGRRAALKLALSAFLAVGISQLLGYPSSGALFCAVTVAVVNTSGTAFAKSLLVVAGVGLGLAVILLLIGPAMPNLQDPGNFLLLSIAAFAPTAWLSIAGSQVRSAGLFGTAIVAIGLYTDFRPHVDLQFPTIFGLTIAVGALVVGAVDHLVWPVDPRRAMWRQASLLLHATAALYRERDPRLVLEHKWGPEWHVHHHLVALVQHRSERAGLSGTPRFEDEEQALRIAAWAQHLVVARVEEARREVQGLRKPDAEAARDAVAALLDERAAEVGLRAR